MQLDSRSEMVARGAARPMLRKLVGSRAGIPSVSDFPHFQLPQCVRMHLKQLPTSRNAVSFTS
jgi:hypothetical protein